MAEDRYLGIDVGGSKTTCLVGDGTVTLGRGTAGAGNPSLVGLDGFRAAIATAAREALNDLSPASIVVAWLGVAGSEQPLVRDQLRAAAAKELGAARTVISHDARLLLAAADVTHGIGLVAGTGSSAFGVSESGREVSVGGWGHLLGDEGSGHDIAVRALRAVTAAIDGRGPHTRLGELLFERLAVRDANELRERCYPAPAINDIARLAETVLAAADSDHVAGTIVDAAADELMKLVDACAAGAVESSDARAVPVVLAGGLLAPGSALHRRLVERLAAPPIRYCPIVPTREPAAGGLALARAGPREPPIEHIEPTRDSGNPAIEERNP